MAIHTRLPHAATLVLLFACGPAPSHGHGATPPEPVVESLRLAWTAGPGQVAALAAEEDRDGLVRALGKAWSQRAWLGGRPPIGEGLGVEDGTAGTALVRLELAGGELVSRWVVGPGGWTLEELELPLVGLEERVAGAWASGDPAALAPWLREAGQVDDLRADLAGRGLEALPAAASWEVREEGGRARLSVPGSELELRLLREGPVWLLDGWDLPDP